MPFNHQPADMREEKSTGRIVRVCICFCVSVMRPVISYPFIKMRLIEQETSMKLLLETVPRA